MVHPDDRDSVERFAEQSQHSGAARSLEHRIVREDGAVRWLSTNWEPVDDDTRTPGRMVGTTQDVTERKAAERAVADSRAKSALLGRVSHELRIPLNGVIGMTELLLEGDLAGEQRSTRAWPTPRGRRCWR